VGDFICLAHLFRDALDFEGLHFLAEEKKAQLTGDYMPGSD